MCTTCGCSQGETRIEGQEAHEHEHRHEDGTVHPHAHTDEGERSLGLVFAGHSHLHRHADGTVHDHPHVHEGEHSHDEEQLDYGAGPARAHAPGMSQERMVKIEQDILAKNDEYARRNREYLAERGVFALNFVSSPGAGKTTLLVRTIEALMGKLPMVVIEGDQQTSRDAERIRATGVPALQINTGKGCHLDASMVGSALSRLNPPEDGLVLVENVGNLVCPSAFDLGEAHKVVILSVAEGEDKPLKYPDMFHAARLMLLNKVDLLPYLSFNVPLAIENARRVNPNIEVILTSAVSGEGIGEWLQWVESGSKATQERRAEAVATLKKRVAELEAQLHALQGR